MQIYSGRLSEIKDPKRLIIRPKENDSVIGCDCSTYRIYNLASQVTLNRAAAQIFFCVVSSTRIQFVVLLQVTYWLDVLFLMSHVMSVMCASYHLHTDKRAIAHFIHWCCALVIKVSPLPAAINFLLLCIQVCRNSCSSAVTGDHFCND